MYTTTTAISYLPAPFVIEFVSSILSQDLPKDRGWFKNSIFSSPSSFIHSSVSALGSNRFGKRSVVIARPVEVWLRRYRSEEHTSELQSHSDLVCRLLLEKKKNQQR